MIEWIIICGLVIAMYIILYKYEKKMQEMQKVIDNNSDNIDKNHERLNNHYNHIEKLWITNNAKHIHKKENEVETKD